MSHVFAIRASAEVCRLRQGAGTRRRTVRLGNEATTHRFGREPVYLDRLPPEIEADPHLRVTQLKEVPEGARIARLDAEAAAEATSSLVEGEEGEGAADPSPSSPAFSPDDPPPGGAIGVLTVEELKTLTVAQLRDACRQMGLPVHGNKAALQNRLKSERVQAQEE